MRVCPTSSLELKKSYASRVDQKLLKDITIDIHNHRKQDYIASIPSQPTTEQYQPPKQPTTKHKMIPQNWSRISPRTLIFIASFLILMLRQQVQARARDGDTVVDASGSDGVSATNLQQDTHKQSVQSPQQQQQHQQQPRAINPSYQFDMQVNPYMQLHKLGPTSNNITCNDGSQVGYYMRLNKHSKSWIIYLQGGGFCGNEESCQQRWQRSAYLMSSNYWPKTKQVDGILSTEPKENPYLWNANHIYVPYCSSDSWSGLAQANPKNGSSFSFMGSKIIERVLESLYDDLARDSSLYEARFILLAGDSAGATGVILNLDKVNEIVQTRASSVRTSDCATMTGEPVDCEEPKQRPVLRGLADSGWFLDNEPYDFDRGESYMNEQEVEGQDDCNRQRCSPSQSIKQAKLLWNGQVPAACAHQYPQEPWRCYFGYRAYQTLITPLFVVQWLYDEAQLMVDNIARPDTTGQWTYVNKVVNEMRTSLENVTALFAPSCFAHSLITRRIWNQININGFKLPHVLNSWEEQSLLGTVTAIESKQSKDHEAPQPFQAHQSPDHSSSIGGGGAQQQTGLTYNNSSFPSFVNQPTFETVLVEQEPIAPQLGSSSPFNLMNQKDAELTIGSQLIYEPRQNNMHRSLPLTSGNSGRSRNLRKRRRNHQPHRAKQVRHKSLPATESVSSISEVPAMTTKEPIDLGASTNPLQDLLPLIDRSLASSDLLYGRLGVRDTSGFTQFNNGRLGRSTIVDDATLMQSNNVPDDNPPPSFASYNLDQHPSPKSWTWSTMRNGFVSPNKQHLKADRFRLIDSCGWPQCNRDCPMLESEMNLAGLA